MTEPTHSFYIAGVQYHEYKEATPHIAEGNHLRLVPDPTNKYDPNAVEIIWETEEKSFFLGFVPKKYSSEVAAMLEVEPLQCVLVEFNASAKPWEMFRVEISRGG